MRGNKALGQMQRSTTYITVSCNYTDISVQAEIKLNVDDDRNSRCDIVEICTIYIAYDGKNGEYIGFRNPANTNLKMME